MIILVGGTWRTEVAEEFREYAEEVGKALAEKGHILLTGGGTGMSKVVVESYKKNNGKKYIAMMPCDKVMKEVGEEVGPEPDEFVQEETWDYPIKNIELVKASEAVIALPGSLGSLTEVIHAVNDYGKPVAVYDKGPLADMINHISKLKEKVFLSKDIGKLVDYLEKKE